MRVHLALLLVAVTALQTLAMPAGRVRVMVERDGGSGHAPAGHVQGEKIFTFIWEPTHGTAPNSVAFWARNTQGVWK
jgi:hypothetical protein